MSETGAMASAGAPAVAPGPARAASPSWSILLTIDVTHGWYAGGGRIGLRWAADAPTTHWLRRAGVLLRQQGDALVLLHEGGRLPEAPMHWHAPLATAREEALPLRFVASCDDTRWFAVTAGLPLRGGRRLHFVGLPVDASRSGGAPEAGPASEGSLESPLERSLERAADLDDEQLQASPGPVRRAAGAPVVVASLPVPGAATPCGVRWRLALAARATVWKYLLVGPWGREAMRIVDVDAAASFDAPVPQLLADGSAALAIRSQAPIPLAERGAQRFQLMGRREANAAEQILVRRLPLADATQFALERSAGGTALVSEILVHR